MMEKYNIIIFFGILLMLPLCSVQSLNSYPGSSITSGYSFFGSHKNFNDLKVYNEYKEQFPWLVDILNPEVTEINTREAHDEECQGSLIHPQAVLTVAQCVIDLSPNDNWVVQAGYNSYSLSEGRYPSQFRNISKIEIHRRYYNSYDDPKNNYAILILDKPMELNDYVGVVCLPDYKIKINQSNCFINNFQFSRPVPKHKDCEKFLNFMDVERYKKLHNSVFCTFYMSDETEIGLSPGVPLVCSSIHDRNVFIHVGHLSHMAHEMDILKLYSSTLYAKQWIYDVLSQYDLQ